MLLAIVPTYERSARRDAFGSRQSRAVAYRLRDGTGIYLPPFFCSNMWRCPMPVSELYRQRAAECERMALELPNERDSLKEIAKTWRWLADAADDLAETAKTLH
jgi:hypothetical protein